MEPTSEIPAEAPESNSQLERRHRTNFHALAFPNGLDHIVGTSKLITYQQWTERVHIIQHWESGTEHMDVSAFRKHHRYGYKLVKDYMVKDNSSGPLLVHRKSEKIMVYTNQAFDCIIIPRGRCGCEKNVERAVGV